MDDVCQPGNCTKCRPLDIAGVVLQRRSSDQQRFDHLVARHQRSVMTYAMAVTGERWAADEAVQDTFTKAWRYFDSFRGDGCFEGWLIRICRNCIITNAKSDHFPPVEHSLEAVVMPDFRPEIMVLLENLSLAQREALTLCRLLGYSYEAAGVILDVPTGTIRSRVARGRSALAEAIEKSRAG